ncbi:hypothetical protein DPMN_149858 [Dreissena polymorpha]|uniref:Sushi domain-containing protein n=1 Tax=Dreissena polymorpha TaxID=45954 RepID=A0A9D4FEK8_DREPO|nr:hypothetical protein DPMN_149858 [Dreissena polymorpha]
MDAITHLPVPDLVMDGVNVTWTCADGRTLSNFCVDGSWSFGYLPCLKSDLLQRDDISVVKNRK